jgi:predicted transcriptional regulator
VRKQPNWFAKWDDRILEFLYEQGASSPGKIAEDEYIRVSSSYVSRRLNELADNGLVDRAGNGVYKITREGNFYLAGGYDPQTNDYLHETDPERGIRTYEHMGLYMKELVDKLDRR